MLAKIQNRVSGFFGLNKGIQQTQLSCAKETVYGLKTSDLIPVTLKSVDTCVNIKGCTAEVVSTIKYTNEESTPVDVVFTLPLCDNIGLYGFEASIYERKIVTEVQQKPQIEATVENGEVQEENKSGDVFRCSLGTLPAGKDAHLIISFVTELPHEADGRVRFTLPSALNPRYYTAESSATPEGDAHACQCNAPYRFTISAIIAGYSQIKSVTSDKLELNVEIEKGDTIAEVTLGEEFRFDHDLTFHIEYHKPFVPRLITESGHPEKDGIFKEDLLMVSFQPELKEMHNATGGEYIFLVDRSKSMGGCNMQYAKEALLVFLKNLPAKCRFNIVCFGTTYSCLFEESAVYDVTSLKKALELQGNMRADMETSDLYKALEHVLKSDVQKEHRNVFLLTDGGVDSFSEVTDLIQKHRDTNRVFALGIGACAFTSLVKRMAQVGNGIAEFVDRKTEIESKVRTLLQCTVVNAVTDLELVWDLPPNVTVVTIPTERPNMLTVGQRLNFFALLSGVNAGKATGSLKLKALQNKIPLNFTLPFDLTEKEPSTKSKSVHRIATRTHILSIQEEEVCVSKEIKDCIEFYQQNDLTLRQKDLRQQIIELSRHGNMGSMFTSFVALDSDSRNVVGKVEPKIVSPYIVETTVVLRRKSDSKSAERTSVIETVKRAVGLQDRPFKFSRMSYSPSETMNAQARNSNSRGGQRLPIRPKTYMETSLTSLALRQQEAIDQDDNLFQVIRCQELAGHWASSTQLNDLINISDDKLKSIETIPGLVLFDDRVEVVLTLAVLAWIRKHHQDQKDEWWLNEMKAKLWLGEKGLGRPVDDILKEVQDAIIKS